MPFDVIVDTFDEIVTANQQMAPNSLYFSVLAGIWPEKASHGTAPIATSESWYSGAVGYSYYRAEFA